MTHAVEIKANGRTVGAINEWSPKMTRGIQELQELGVVTGAYSKKSGEPFEKVPNNVGGMTVDVRRYDLYLTDMEEAFGTVDVTMLSNQDDPFDVRESWTSPNNARNYARLFQGCWFSNLGRTLSATSDRTVNVNATIEYTRVDRLNA